MFQVQFSPIQSRNLERISNKCIATSNKCITSSYYMLLYSCKKLLVYRSYLLLQYIAEPIGIAQQHLAAWRSNAMYAVLHRTCPPFQGLFDGMRVQDVWTNRTGIDMAKPTTTTQEA